MNVEVLLDHFLNSEPGLQDLDFVKRCVEADPTIVSTQHPANQALPLHYACISGAPYEIVHYLLEKYPGGLQVAEENGMVPLHCACQINNFAIIRLLLEHPMGQGTIQTMRKYSTIPLSISCINRPALELVRYLVNLFPASVKRTDENGMLPVHVACQNYASLEVIQYLIRLYPESIHDKAYAVGWTPLQFALHPKKGDSPDARIVAWLHGVESGRISLDQNEAPHDYHVNIPELIAASPKSPIPNVTSPSLQLRSMERGAPNETLKGVACLSFRTVLSLESFLTRQEMENAQENAFLIPPDDDLWFMIFVSHRWDPKDNVDDENHHPDPQGWQLHNIQEFIRMALSLFLVSRYGGQRVEEELGLAVTDSLEKQGWLQAVHVAGNAVLCNRQFDASTSMKDMYEALLDHCAIWYDYTCLYQKPRTSAQEESFRDCLLNLREIVKGSSCTLSLRRENDNYESSGWCQWEIVASSATDYTTGTCYFPLQVKIETLWDDFENLPGNMKNALLDWEPYSGAPATLQATLRRASDTLMESFAVAAMNSPTNFAIVTHCDAADRFGRAFTPRIQALCDSVLAGQGDSVDIGTACEESLREAGLTCTNGSDRRFLGLKMLEYYSPPGIGVQGFSRRMIREAIFRWMDKKSLSLYLLQGGYTNPHGSSWHFEDDTVGYLLYPPRYQMPAADACIVS